MTRRTSLLALFALAAFFVLAFAPQALAGYREAVLADSPAGYWRFEDETVSTLAVDSSGNGNHGTYSGSWTLISGLNISGLPSKALSLSGGGHVAVPASSRFVGSGGLTVEGWVVANGVGFATVASPRQSVTSGWWAGIYAGNRALEMTVPGTGFSIDNYDLPGQWTHVAYVFDPLTSTVRLYKDGVETASYWFFSTNNFSCCPGALADSGLYLGANPEPGRYYPWNGYLDELAVYDKALTAAQVQAHYQASFDTTPVPCPDGQVRDTNGNCVPAPPAPPPLPETKQDIKSSELSDAERLPFVVNLVKDLKGVDTSGDPIGYFSTLATSTVSYLRTTHPLWMQSTGDALLRQSFAEARASCQAGAEIHTGVGSIPCNPKRAAYIWALWFEQELPFFSPAAHYMISLVVDQVWFKHVLEAPGKAAAFLTCEFAADVVAGQTLKLARLELDFIMRQVAGQKGSDLVGCQDVL